VKPSNQIQKFRLMCSSAYPGQPGIVALDTSRDLFALNGARARIPTLTLPVGGTLDTDRVALFRAECEWACDRVSLYLVNAGIGPGIGKPNPPQFLIEIRLGPPCAEEVLVQAVVDAPTYQDAGHIVTFATSQLWDSIALSGCTLEGTEPVPVNFRLYADRAGICCAENPIYGEMADAP
jgi:hypothetical protein